MKTEKAEIKSIFWKIIIILLVVWAIIVLGVMLFNANSKAAAGVSSVSKDIKSSIEEMQEGSLQVNTSNMKSFDYQKEAIAYMDKIDQDYQDRAQADIKYGHSAHPEIIKYIKKELKNAGYANNAIVEDEHTRMNMNSDDMDLTNIMCTLKGKDDSKKIIIGAHYDGKYEVRKKSVGTGTYGTALLLAEACGLKESGVKPEYTILFIFFDGGEEGTYGSSWYADNMKSDEVNSTLFMLNIDEQTDAKGCMLYGGHISKDGVVIDTEAYNYALNTAKALGLTVTEPKGENAPAIASDGDQAPFDDANVEYIDVAANPNKASQNMGICSTLVSAILLGTK